MKSISNQWRQTFKINTKIMFFIFILIKLTWLIILNHNLSEANQRRDDREMSEEMLDHTMHHILPKKHVFEANSRDITIIGRKHDKQSTILEPSKLD